MTVDDQMDILIAKFLSGEALPEEATKLEDWLNLSPGNKAYFNKHAALFEVSLDISSGDKNLAWTNIIGGIDKEAPDRKSKPLNWKMPLIAASVMLLIANGLLINKFTKEDVGAAIYKADAISKKVFLKDNTEINVSPNSSILVDKGYGIRTRKIALTGSASFSVRHSPLMPLIVDVRSLHIKDIGTRFSVASTQMSDTIFITVNDGEISVYDDFGSSENAGAGENVLYIRSKKKIVVFQVKHDPAVVAQTKRRVVTHNTKQPTAIPQVPLIVPPAADTPQREIAARHLDSTQSERIVTDLVLDGLIIRGQPLSFTISDTAFILNGKRQPAVIFERYRNKYGGRRASAGWTWHHAENMPSKEQ